MSLTHESLSETIPEEENRSYIPGKYFCYQVYLNLVQFSSKSPKIKISVRIYIKLNLLTGDTKENGQKPCQPLLRGARRSLFN